MIDEAILIEISKRFRKLEDAIESADKVLLARQRHYASLLVDSHKCLELVIDPPDSTEQYDDICQRIKHEETEVNRLKSIRESLESCAEACREDMVLMSERLRENK